MTLAPHHDPTFVRHLLQNIKFGTSITVCARTASTWAEQYSDIEQAVISRNIQFQVVVADDNAVMGTDNDLGKPDVTSSVEKFRLIAIPDESFGEFRLYRNPIFLPLSYVSWEPSSGPPKALLTAGAGLSQASQNSISLTAPDSFMTALDQVFGKIVAGSRLEFRRGGKTKRTIGLPKPRIFVASSKQSLPIAYEVQQSLQHMAEVTVWDQGVFRSPESTFGSLVMQLDRSDYGVFVFAADDVILTGGKEFRSVRDNVLFEYGLFVGRLGRNRNWFMLPSKADDIKNVLKVASDLFGVTPLLYDDVPIHQRAAAIGRACHDIRFALETAR